MDSTLEQGVGRVAWKVTSAGSLLTVRQWSREQIQYRAKGVVVGAMAGRMTGQVDCAAVVEHLERDYSRVPDVGRVPVAVQDLA